MKKLVAISVLFAMLCATAAFAQDDRWTVGFKAQLARNIFKFDSFARAP